MRYALTIAGTDPTGGAGLQADLKVFRALGVHGLSVVAALTAQNTARVADIRAVDAAMLASQLTCLLDDIRPDALKTGMLHTRDAVMAVADAVKRYGLKNLVIDPVTVSSTGTRLLEESALDALRTELFPLARVITPNIYEAFALSGVKADTPEQMAGAARALRAMGPEVVIVTGGHLEAHTVDVVFDGTDVRLIEGTRHPGEFHGTGCAYSAAIAAWLALGSSPMEAASQAKGFVGMAIQSALHPGKGMGLLGI